MGGGLHAAAAAAGIGYGSGVKTKKSYKFGNAKPVDIATKMKQLEGETAAMLRVTKFVESYLCEGGGVQ